MDKFRLAAVADAGATGPVGGHVARLGQLEQAAVALVPRDRQRRAAEGDLGALTRVHLIKDGHASEDASAGNTALIDALRKGGDLLNVFGDFPTLRDPRHSQAYSPLWDAQLGLWTDKAVKAGLDTRQIGENVVFQLRGHGVHRHRFAHERSKHD